MEVRDLLGPGGCSNLVEAKEGKVEPGKEYKKKLEIFSFFNLIGVSQLGHHVWHLDCVATLAFYVCVHETFFFIPEENVCLGTVTNLTCQRNSPPIN